MGEHTPGPWEITWERDTDHEGAKRAISIGPIIPVHDHWSGWTITDEMDAHLIAAAPDLLAALCDIMQVIATDELVPESVSYMRQARTAIAATEGGE